MAKGRKDNVRPKNARAISRTEPVDKSAAVMKVLQGNFREGWKFGGAEGVAS